MSLESVSSDRPEEPDPKDDGDDAIIAAMSTAGEVTDSSIVEVGRSRPQFQYSREELMDIKTLPLAKRRPECLDVAHNKCLISSSRGVWEPERWHADRKRSETPPEEEPRVGTKPEQNLEPQNKRRSGDPRERIRKEQDGIVLSPQRRSFNSGCFVNVTQPPPRRPESPIGKSEVPHREPVRRIGSGRLLTRDIWDFRTETDKSEPERADFSFRGSGNSSNRDRDGGRDRERDNIRESHDRNERFERRPFGRDYGDRDMPRDRGSDMRNDRAHMMDRDKEQRGRVDRKYGNERRRTYEHREPEEPEWFSSGPISQHDTIELRGFDDVSEEKTKTKKASAAQKKRSKKLSNEKEEKSSDNSSGPKGRSTPTIMDQPIIPAVAPHSPISEQNNTTRGSETEKERSSECSTLTESIDRSSDANKAREGVNFDLDELLKSDTLPGVTGLLTNGVSAAAGSGSRFSQWFKRASPQDDNHGPTIHDELLNNLLDDITEPNIQVPSVTESNTYFAPISPANSSSANQLPQPATGTKLLEMLQRGNKPNQNGQGDAATNDVIQKMKNTSMKDREFAGMVMHSVEELEARMRGNAPPAKTAEPNRANHTEEDLSAFNKLLAQVTGGQVVPAANGPNNQKAQQISTNLMQLLKSQQTQPPMQIGPRPPMVSEQPPHPPMYNHAGPLGPTQHPHQAQMQHENLMKVLRIQQQQQQQQKQRQQQQQQQSDMLSMMMSGGQRMVGASPIPTEMQILPSSRELLQRPEALAIIQGLQQGEITRQHLIQQLQNPAMQHRHREVLVNILKMYGNTTPRAASPHTGSSHDPIIQQLLYQQQQQQQQHQRIPSPMNNVMPHRVPSPRDLVMHTQSIMQNALIKTKLEEQREKFRKQQEQQQHHIQHHHHQQQRIASPVNSPSKQMMSPTPLAFTPTSVLRKMTAEKEPDGNIEGSKIASQNKDSQEKLDIVREFSSEVYRRALMKNQPVQNQWSPPVSKHSSGSIEASKIAAQNKDSQEKLDIVRKFSSEVYRRALMESQQQPPPPQQTPWSSTVNKHPGRPIVKGGTANQFVYPSGPTTRLQQQQQTPSPRPSTHVFGTNARSKHTMSTSLSQHNYIMYNMTSNLDISQRSEPPNSQMSAQSHFSSMQLQNEFRASQHILNENYNSNRSDGRLMRPQQQPMNIPIGRQASSPGNGGSLSPTSNQLARWFTSPELLAKAKAVKLPELGQLSLAELERLQQASTTVHD